MFWNDLDGEHTHYVSPVIEGRGCTHSIIWRLHRNSLQRLVNYMSLQNMAFMCVPRIITIFDYGKYWLLKHHYTSEWWLWIGFDPWGSHWHGSPQSWSVSLYNRQQCPTRTMPEDVCPPRTGQHLYYTWVLLWKQYSWLGVASLRDSFVYFSVYWLLVSLREMWLVSEVGRWALSVVPWGLPWE